MNIDHLRKQAKNLVKLYPDLVAGNPAELTLSAAQGAITRINGYPNWESMVFASRVADGRGGKRKSDTSPLDPAFLVAELQKAICFRRDPEPSRLSIAYSKQDGSPTRFVDGHELHLDYATDDFREKARLADDALHDAFEEAGMSFDGRLDTIKPDAMSHLIEVVEASLRRCPFNLEGVPRLAGCYLQGRRDADVLAFIEPIAKAVLAMLPENENIHVSYYELDNRPFHRMMLHYVLALDRACRHVDADAAAKRMLGLWPNDNIGFRFMRTKALRAKARA
jgi:hypothetical protein